MKFFKYLTLTILIYLFFTTSVFLSIDSPTADYSQALPIGKNSAIKLTLSNLLPQLKYNIEVFLDKQTAGEFIIENENKKIIYKSSDKFREQKPIKFSQVKNKKIVSFYLYEIPPELTEEEIAYQRELDRLRANFLQKTIDDIKSGDSTEVGKDIEIISRGGPYPGQEKLKPPPVPPKPPELKKLIARPVKNLDAFLAVNKIILTSYKDYLSKDMGFKTVYLFLITGTLWLILKIKKEIR